MSAIHLTTGARGRAHRPLPVPGCHPRSATEPRCGPCRMQTATLVRALEAVES